MLPSEMRALLLSQHRAIRELAMRLLDAAARHEADPLREPSVLRGTIDALGIALATHNRDEQHLLEHALPAADAWGAVRCASMDDHHRYEHGSMRSALIASTQLSDSTALSAHLRHLVEDLFEHMDIEERVLLSPNVLRDDVVAIDTFGG